MTNIVTGPLAVVKDEQGAAHYFYQGAPVPSYVKGEQLKHLQDAGLVSAGSKAESSDESESAKPAGNASLEEWQGYAKTQGASDDDLDGLSRNDLRDKYGK